MNFNGRHPHPGGSSRQRRLDERLRTALSALRHDLTREPDEDVTERHLGAIFEAARQAAHGVPASRGWRARVSRVLAATTLKVAVGATAAAAATTGGLAATGALPERIERAVVDVVRHVGVRLPTQQRPTVGPPPETLAAAPSEQGFEDPAVTDIPPSATPDAVLGAATETRSPPQGSPSPSPVPSPAAAQPAVTGESEAEACEPDPEPSPTKASVSPSPDGSEQPSPDGSESPQPTPTGTQPSSGETVTPTPSPSAAAAPSPSPSESTTSEPEQTSGDGCSDPSPSPSAGTPAGTTGSSPSPTPSPDGSPSPSPSAGESPAPGTSVRGAAPLPGAADRRRAGDLRLP